MIGLMVPNVYGQPIPQWVKNTTELWHDGQITDDDYIDFIEYLVNEKAIIVESELTSKVENARIPDWIRNNAEYWVRSQIDDKTFATGIEFFAANGIIGISEQKSKELASIIQFKKESTISGVEIILTNIDSKPHAAFDLNYMIFAGNILYPNENLTTVVTEEGNHEIICLIHPWEKGIISIKNEELLLMYQEIERKKQVLEQERLANLSLTEQFDEISQDFFASLTPTYLNYFDETEEEKIIDFMDEGEEKIKRMKTLEDKLAIITDSGSDFITSDNIHRANLSYDDKIFLVETNLDVIDYLKYRMNQQAKEVEIQYELAMKGFNEWDAPDEIKAEYIEDLESSKLQFTNEFIPGMIHIIAKQELELENLLVQLKKENQITNEIYDSQKQFEPESIKEQKVEPKPILSFVDPEKDPSHYVKRYITEETYKDWFNEHFPDYTLYEGIGITQEEYRNIVNELTKPEPVPEPVVTPEPELEPEPTPTQESSEGGGCLIATAAFGSEMAPQVQFLREIRDNTVMSTESGTTFMNTFNQFYYFFSPQIADYERENPVFKEAVKVTLTPLLTSLTLLNYVEIDSEEEMLGYGIGIILLNVGMYFVAPAVLIISLKKKLQK